MGQNGFSWDAFSDDTVRRLARCLGWSAFDHTDARDWLSTKVKMPTDRLIAKARYALESTWLTEHPEVAAEMVEEMLDRDIGFGHRPQRARGYVEYIRDCPDTKAVRSLMLKYLRRSGRPDMPGDPRIPSFAVLDTRKALDPRRGFPFQHDAWGALSWEFCYPELKWPHRGILAMPTGSGKTFTAVNWLLLEVVNAGWRVLWVSHSYELLDQAASEFHAQAGLVSSRDFIRVRIVSSQHCAASSVSPCDDVVVCSVYSLTSKNGVVSGLLSDPRLFLVIDEAHHSVATTYRRVIETIPAGTAKILGLTATPTRTSPDERSHLAAMFSHNTIYQVSMRELIEQDFLAKPIPVRVRTDAAVETGVTEADRRHLYQFHDLSEAWLNRIARIDTRNQVIVDHYRWNRSLYGKTLVFAVNVAHAALLRKLLADLGIDAEYIASYRADGSRADNREIIEQFRDPRGQFDVLINVQMLTEGIDIPNVRTVFLARPTKSEILLRQMVGRALRGPRCGGTETAYVVAFEDRWKRFRGFDRPLDLLSDIMLSAE